MFRVPLILLLHTSFATPSFVNSNGYVLVGSIGPRPTQAPPNYGTLMALNPSSTALSTTANPTLRPGTFIINTNPSTSTNPTIISTGTSPAFTTGNPTVISTGANPVTGSSTSMFWLNSVQPSTEQPVVVYGQSANSMFYLNSVQPSAVQPVVVYPQTVSNGAAVPQTYYSYTAAKGLPATSAVYLPPSYNVQQTQLTLTQTQPQPQSTNIYGYFNPFTGQQQGTSTMTVPSGTVTLTTVPRNTALAAVPGPSTRTTGTTTTTSTSSQSTTVGQIPYNSGVPDPYNPNVIYNPQYTTPLAYQADAATFVSTSLGRVQPQQ